MNTIKLYILLVFVVLVVLPSKAQIPQKTQTIKESVDQLKSIFGKKKDTDSKAAVPTSQTVRHLKGGTNAENLIYIDVDYMNDFNDGKAIVRKGNATAMIDKDGNTIVPFNTYGFVEAWNVNSGMANPDNTYVYHNHEVAGTGFFKYRASAQTGYDNYLNAQAITIKSPVPPNATFALTLERNYLVSKKSLNDQVDQQGNRYNTYYYQDREGKLFVHSPSELTAIHDGIGIVSRAGKKGYVFLNGTKLTDIVFDDAMPFSDGMAVVGLRDQFGILKYGFIDMKGEIAIPVNFSKQPTHFSKGFAIVYPKDYPSKDDQLAYAFVNKKGEVVRSFTLREQRLYNFPPFQNYGLTYAGHYFMDTDFRIINRKDFFARYGLSENIAPIAASFDRGRDKGKFRQHLFSVVGEENPKIYFAGKDGIGFVNLISNTVVLPIFTQLGFFDPVSGLAYAEIGKNQNITKGYINASGEWVILQAKGSQW
ncbi:WG repeat-containing protein [Sphingobacterium sp. LRF_L2]|uniref:WG repeat-containing protein n=1 Tax=Sphingobacterium sp. LRF_L2 TaxID=3369421 RepID=UPI003F5E6121